MATYRPKKLNEINSVFDESVKAKEALKQVSEGISETTSVQSEVKNYAPAEDGFKEIPLPQVNSSQDISAIAGDFILRFGTPERAQATAKLRESEVMKTKVIPSVETSKLKAKPLLKESNTETAENNQGSVSLSDSVGRVSVPTISRASAERNQLLEDYKRVMNDEDEESLSSRWHKRDKKHKPKKPFFKPHDVKTEDISETEPTEAPIETSPETVEEQETVAEQLPEILEEVQPETVPETEEAEDEGFYSINAEEEPEEIQPAEESEEIPEEIPVEAEDEAEEVIPVAEETEPEQEEIPQPKEEEETPEEEFDEYEDIMSRYDDYDYDADYGNYEGFENKPEDIYSTTEKAEKKSKSGKGKAALKVILIILLVLSVVSAALVGTGKLLLGVNTGAIVSDRYSFFTSEGNYPFVEVKQGDLVVTENIYPDENDNFVYADSITRSFVFAKQKGTYVDLKGDVIFIAESEGQRETVYRDDTRGVIIKTIPAVGAVVSLIDEYYVIVIAILLCIAVALLLIVIFALGKKQEEYIEEEIEINNDDFEDIYSSSDRADFFDEIE